MNEMKWRENRNEKGEGKGKRNGETREEGGRKWQMGGGMWEVGGGREVYGMLKERHEYCIYVLLSHSYT
jgi:hypothetical protein